MQGLAVAGEGQGLPPRLQEARRALSRAAGWSAMYFTSEPSGAVRRLDCGSREAGWVDFSVQCRTVVARIEGDKLEMELGQTGTVVEECGGPAVQGRGTQTLTEVTWKASWRRWRLSGQMQQAWGHLGSRSPRRERSEFIRRAGDWLM